jgi:hypothetical protein
MLSESKRFNLIKKGVRSLPKLKPFRDELITPDLWEYVVYSDSWNRRITLFNEISGIFLGN